MITQLKFLILFFNFLLILSFTAQAYDLESKDPYNILGLNSKSTPVEIKRAYRKATTLFHPDKFPDLSKKQKKIKEQEFKTIAEAYKKLTEQPIPSYDFGISESELKEWRKRDEAKAERAVKLKREQYILLSDDDLIKEVTLNSRNINSEIAMVEFLKRGNKNNLIKLLNITEEELIKFSRVPIIVLQALKGQNNLELLEFLKRVSTKRYAYDRHSVQVNIEAVARAILERLDQPDMLSAAINLAEKNFLDFSEVPIIILEGFSGRNDPEILEFIARISQNNFTSIKQFKAVTDSIEERKHSKEFQKIMNKVKRTNNCLTKIMKFY